MTYNSHNPHNNPHAEHPGASANAMEARIDQMLDGQLNHQQMRAAYDEIRACPDARNELASLRLTVAQLRSPVEHPDLTESILYRVNARQRFLPRRAQRFVWLSRLAVAAGLVVAVGLTALTQRTHPELLAPSSSVRSTGQHAVANPVTNVVQSAAEAAPSPGKLARTITSTLVSPVARLSLDRKLEPEANFHFNITDNDLMDDQGHTYRSATLPTSIERDIAYAYPLPSSLFSLPRLNLHTLPLRASGEHSADGQRSPVVTDKTLLPSTNPFISRFDSLLVVLRQPPVLPSEQPDQVEDDDR